MAGSVRRPDGLRRTALRDGPPADEQTGGGSPPPWHSDVEVDAGRGDPERGVQRSDDTWRAHPVLGALLRVAVLLVPLLVGVRPPCS